jgi:hypothetical protein
LGVGRRADHSALQNYIVLKNSVIEAGLPIRKVKKEQNGRKSLRRLKPTAGCNGSKKRRTGLTLILLMWRIG